MNFENEGTTTKPMSRSESLTEAFKSFMEADFRLHEARNNEHRLRGELNMAQAELAEAEQYWTKRSELLAKELMSAAPAQLQPQMAPSTPSDYAAQVQVGQCETKPKLGLQRW